MVDLHVDRHVEHVREDLQQRRVDGRAARRHHARRRLWRAKKKKSPHCRVGRGNLVLGHSFPLAPPNAECVAC